MVEPPLFALHVVGIGEFAVKNDDGERCLFLFCAPESISEFVENEFVQAGSHYKEFAAIPFESLEMISQFLSDIQATTKFIAFDPLSSGQFTPRPVCDVLRELQARCN